MTGSSKFPVVPGWLPSLYIKIEMFRTSIQCILGKTITLKISKNNYNSAIICQIKLRRLVGATTFTINDGG